MLFAKRCDKMEAVHPGGKAMKMTTMNALGSICGGMTSTPALGTLIAVANTDAIATSYAATYPIALIAVVLSSQLLPIIL